jgi:hypothetical protein
MIPQNNKIRGYAFGDKDCEKDWKMKGSSAGKSAQKPYSWEID